MKKILILFIFLIKSVFLFSQVVWPWPTNNQQTAIIGSIGEYRYTANGNEHRFHKGIDITNGTELSVHSINSGAILYNNSGDAWTSWVSVGNIFYWHMQPSLAILTGIKTDAAINDYLGELLTEDIGEHLHLQEGDGSRNFLQHGLSPYVDNSAPFFCSDYITINNGVAFYQNGLTKERTDYASLLLNNRITLNSIQYTVLYNKVDIAAHVKDYRTNSDGSGNTGQITPYEINWRVRNQSNTIVAGDRLTFNTTPNNAAALYCFYPQSVNPGNPSIHIITSHISQTNFDRYWNTNLRTGITNTWPTDNSQDAYCGLDTESLDGLYTVEINAFDVDYNDNPNRSAPQQSINVLIDNYRPYVKKVVFRKGSATGEIVYTGEWTWNGSALTYSSQSGVAITDEEAVWIKVFSSEPMQALTLTAFGETKSGTSENNGNEWVYTYTASQVNSGSQQLTFISSSSLDLANNQLEGFTSSISSMVGTSIPKHQSNGTWFPSASQNNDSRHNINIETSINADFTYNPVYGDFPLRVTFTDVSTGNPTNWLWNFGDGGTSTEKNPSHIFNNPNTYSVSLKVSNSSSSSTKVIPVKLEDKVYASFTADKTSGAYPLAVKFTNTSQGNPTSFSWNFGDGGTSTLQSPSHTYASAGNFTVLLTVNKGVYSDVSDPLTINTSHPAVKISGRVIEVLNGIPGLKVKAIKSDDGTITSSTTTNTNGDYQLNVPYGWSGKILVEGGNGYTDYFVNFTNLTQDKTGIDLLVSKVELNISYSLVEGTYYKFEAIGAPIGTTTYEWSYSDGTSITTSSWIDYHIFNCFTDHSVNYTISLIVYGDKTFTAKPIILNIPRCIDVTAVAINEECNLIPLGSEVTIIDNSYPVSDISKYNITWGGGNSEIWDTEICKGSNCYSSSHFIYRANCKTFKYTYKNAGHYSGYLEAYNLASQKSEPDYFTYDVVDCSKSITSSNLANAYLYTSGGIYYYYAGSYNLINLNAISNFINKNVAITACNNIILKPGISIKPNLGKKVVLKTSSCLDKNDSKSSKSIERETWEFEDIEYFNPNCNNYEVLTENDDILNSDVEVFPNPNMGEFKIVFKNSSNIQLVEIINSNGYLIQRKLGTQNNKYDFNISDNSSGLYLVKVYYDNKIETYKIIYH